MSVEAVRSVLTPGFPDRSTGRLARSTVRLVAVAVADIVNDAHGWELYASLQTIADRTGVHRDTVRLVLRHLTTAGVISEGNPSPGQATRYVWLWRVPGGGGSRTMSNRDRDIREGVADCSAEGVADCSATNQNMNTSDPKVPVNGYAAGGLRAATMAETCPVCRARDGDQCDASARRTKGLSCKMTPAGAHTGRVATAVVRAWWTAEVAGGRRPAGVEYVAVRSIVAKLIDADRHPRRVGDALAALYARGAPITAASLAAQVDGRRPVRAGRGGLVTAEVATDAHGNIL